MLDWDISAVNYTTISHIQNVTLDTCCFKCSASSQCSLFNWHPVGNSGQPTYCQLLSSASGNGTLVPVSSSDGFIVGFSGPFKCQSDLDCSLAGECTNGACVCDGWTHGDACDILNLEPAKSDAFGYRNDSGYQTWGGAPIQGPDGTWHLFVSFMHGKCDVWHHWTHVSQVVRLDSPNPTGPWTYADVIIPSFAHNVKPFRAVTGEWLLYYIGQVNNDTTVCNGTELSTAAPPPRPIPAGGPIRIASAWTVDAPASEWNHTGPLVDSFAWHSGTNPSPWLFANGSVLLALCRRYYEYLKPTFFMKADSWEGPYTNITKDEQHALVAGEDPDIFKTPRGWHMLNHNTGPASTQLLYSPDATTWYRASSNAFNATVVFDNGTVSNLCARQRPQVVLAEDGLPGWLWTSAEDGPPDSAACAAETTPSWTLAQAFGR